MIPVYRTDSYLKSLETVVDGIADEGSTKLITCHEALFAEGGGQPPDHGTLTANGESRAVLELVKHKGDIRLRVEPFNALAKGEKVLCEIDFERRYRIMRLHTAQHALAGCLRRMLGDYQTGGMKIDEAAKVCTMKFVTGKRCDGATMKQGFEFLQNIIAEGHPVYAEQLEGIDQAAGRFGELFRPGDPAVKIKGRVRMIVIEGLDANACGGTHLRNTREIGAVRAGSYLFDAASHIHSIELRF